MDYNKIRNTIGIIIITFFITILVILGIQLYRATIVTLPDPVPIDDLINLGVKSADEELKFMEEHQKEVETVVQYIPIQTYQKVRSLPPDDLVIMALDRARKFSATIGPDYTSSSSKYSTDDPRSGPPGGGVLP